jgi:hypothetical protein
MVQQTGSYQGYRPGHGQCFVPLDARLSGLADVLIT